MKAKPLVAISIIAIILIVIGASAYFAYESTRTHAVYISIEYNGEWQGEIGYDTHIESEYGYGNARYKITWKGSGWTIVSATIQKMDGSYSRLWVGILDENFKTLESGQTTAPYGVVSISWSS